MVASIPLIRCLCYKPERIRLFNSYEILLLGTFLDQEHWRILSDADNSLTLSDTKRVTDLGTLVVPFMQTFHLLHEYRAFENQTFLFLKTKPVLFSNCD